MKKPGSSHLREAWLLFFFMGMIMINFPFIHIFNKDVLVGDIPLLILYFFLGWPLSILVIYIFARMLEKGPKDNSGL